LPDSSCARREFSRSYAGKKDDAQKQYALAAGLYMSAADNAELARQTQGKI